MHESREYTDVLAEGSGWHHRTTTVHRGLDYRERATRSTTQSVASYIVNRVTFLYRPASRISSSDSIPFARRNAVFDVSLSKLTVVKKADLVGRDEPMLWTMFVELSLATIASLEFVKRTDPVKGKLARTGKGESANIPATVGHYHNDASGIFMGGVAVLCFDNDLRTQKQIRDGYAAGATALNKGIRDHFPKFGFAEMTDEEKEDIADATADAITAAFVADSAVFTLFGGKAVGGQTITRTFDVDHIDETFSLTCKPKKNDRAIYRVDGRLRFDRPQQP